MSNERDDREYDSDRRHVSSSEMRREFQFVRGELGEIRQELIRTRDRLHDQAEDIASVTLHMAVMKNTLEGILAQFTTLNGSVGKAEERVRALELAGPTASLTSRLVFAAVGVLLTGLLVAVLAMVTGGRTP